MSKKSKQPKRVVQGGEKLKKKLNKQQSLTRQVEASKKYYDDLFKQLNRKLGQLSFQTARDLGMMQERTMVLWELLWTVIEYLRLEKDISLEDFERELDEIKQIVLARWKQEKLKRIKSELQSPQTLCENCSHVDSDSEFCDEDGNIVCPKCKSDQIYFAEESTPQEEQVA